jgi:hypothetical protein
MKELLDFVETGDAPTEFLEWLNGNETAKQELDDLLNDGLNEMIKESFKEETFRFKKYCKHVLIEKRFKNNECIESEYRSFNENDTISGAIISEDTIIYRISTKDGYEIDLMRNEVEKL